MRGSVEVQIIDGVRRLWCQCGTPFTGAVSWGLDRDVCTVRAWCASCDALHVIELSGLTVREARADLADLAASELRDLIGAKEIIDAEIETTLEAMNEPRRYRSVDDVRQDITRLRERGDMASVQSLAVLRRLYEARPDTVGRWLNDYPALDRRQAEGWVNGWADEVRAMEAVVRFVTNDMGPGTLQALMKLLGGYTDGDYVAAHGPWLSDEEIVLIERKAEREWEVACG